MWPRWLAPNGAPPEEWAHSFLLLPFDGSSGRPPLLAGGACLVVEVVLPMSPVCGSMPRARSETAWPNSLPAKSVAAKKRSLSATLARTEAEAALPDRATASTTGL